MLRHRVIPIVLLDGYSVVKTIQFKTRRNLGNPITVARIYNSRNVDELVLLDIDASKGNRKIDFPTIEEIASECFMPLCVGGGLKTCHDIETVLSKGADKVSINTQALLQKNFIREASAQFGGQSIVVSIDIMKTPQSRYEVYSHAGLKVETALPDLVSKAEQWGAGELLINSVDRDGTMTHYDTELIDMISSLVTLPIITAGGGACPHDGVEGIQAGASAVAFASMFHFTNFTPNDVKREMMEADIPVRYTNEKLQ